MLWVASTLVCGICRSTHVLLECRSNVRASVNIRGDLQGCAPSTLPWVSLDQILCAILGHLHFPWVSLDHILEIKQSLLNPPHNPSVSVDPTFSGDVDISWAIFAHEGFVGEVGLPKVRR